jgi:hypothetical protein
MEVINNRNVLACVHTVTSHFPGAFILIGGASMVARRCDRTTNDVDVLVPPSTNMHQLYQKLVNTPWFFQDGGVLFVKPSAFEGNTISRPLKIDILTDIVSGVGYNDVIGHTDHISGNLLPSLTMSLGVKIRCWYLRAEDDNGAAKRETDLQDVVFLAASLRKQGIQVDSSAAAKVEVCHYHLLAIRLHLQDKDVTLLREVGCSKFLRKYDDENPDQRDLYEAMGAKAYTDPLVVEIKFDDEGEGEVDW